MVEHRRCRRWTALKKMSCGREAMMGASMVEDPGDLGGGRIARRRLDRRGSRRRNVGCSADRVSILDM